MATPFSVVLFIALGFRRPRIDAIRAVPPLCYGLSTQRVRNDPIRRATNLRVRASLLRSRDVQSALGDA